jgi:cytochrome c
MINPLRYGLGGALALLLAFAAKPVLPAPTPDPGARAWLQCRACHSLKPGEPDKTGPNLNRLFGARAGTLRKDYAYSPALKASGIVWDEATLDAWLRQPGGVVRGNRMAFAGIGDPAKRKALIVWLKRETR